MTDKIQKFLRKLDAKQEKRLREIIEKVKHGQLAGLDIKPIAGQKGWYRCRAGKIRIIFIRTGAGQHVIYEINFRGQAYQGL